MDERKIIFTNDDGEEDELYVLEETRINGVNYLLVSDEEDDGNNDLDVYVMKEVASEGEESVYEFVEDEKELDSLADIFAELLGDEEDIVK
ncbi:MAG: DUF1292 domain-containing protein [Lachnospiraceae bacterium]|nr:DUF1292 domain-containing protein [Lachnospiraceae bacterium]